jgi:hypothetical protein
MDTDNWLVFFTGLLAVAGFLQVRVVSKTATKQLRAYLSVDEMPNREDRDLQEPKLKAPEHKLKVIAKVKNFGQTPALNVHYDYHLAFLPIPLPNDFEFPEIKYHGHHQLQPSQEIVLLIESERTFTKQDIECIKTGISKYNGFLLYVYGYISYFDAFNQPHYCKFCFWLDWDHGHKQPPSWMITPMYNESDQVPSKSWIARFVAG